jgi:hypothetical protein
LFCFDFRNREFRLSCWVNDASDSGRFNLQVDWADKVPIIRVDDFEAFDVFTSTGIVDFVDEQKGGSGTSPRTSPHLEYSKENQDWMADWTSTQTKQVYPSLLSLFFNDFKILY